MLSFRNLKIGRPSKEPLIEFSGTFSLKKGLHLLIAPNGFGKTTFMQTIAGLLPPLSGDVLFDSRPPTEREVKYFSEYLFFPKWIRPSEWVPVQVGHPINDDLKSWIKSLRMESLWNRFLGEMSQGERRKVIWLTALSTDQPIILLDEPTRGLDFPALSVVRDALLELKKREKTIILTSHEVGPLLGIVDEIWFLHDRKIKSLPEVSSINPKEVDYKKFLDLAFSLYR